MGQRWRERVIETLIRTCGISAIVIVALIFFFLLKESFGLFQTVTVSAFLRGRIGIRSRIPRNSAFCR